MKSKLKISGILLLLALSLAGSHAQAPSLPVAPQTIDPTTGQPIQPGSDWRDPNWAEPDIVLTSVSFPDLPIAEVARNLQDQFKGKFDIILPTHSTSGAINPLTGSPLEITDWTMIPVRLQLRNVMASEVFNAMNLMFENDHTPLRWELKMLNNRPIALLRVLAVPDPNSFAAKEVQRRVYFVGNLIGDEKSGGMTMEQIIKTVTDIWQMANVPDGKIQFHKDAQLLVVTGTRDQIEFMDQTLRALSEKLDHEKNQQARQSDSQAAAGKSKTEEPAPAKK